MRRLGRSLERLFWSTPWRKGLTATMVLVMLLVSSQLISLKSVHAASTVGTDSYSVNGSSTQHKIVTSSSSSSSTIFAFYVVYSGSILGVEYRTSTNGTSWSGLTMVDSAGSFPFDVAIDSSDNVWVASANTGTVKITKIAYAGSSTWSAPSTVKTYSVVTCAVGTTDGHTYSGPAIAVNSSGNLEVSVLDNAKLKAACANNYRESVGFSTNGSSWPASLTQLLAVTNLSSGGPLIAVGSAFWLLTCHDATCANEDLYKDTTPNGTFSLSVTSAVPMDSTSNLSTVSDASSGSDLLDISYFNSTTGHLYIQCTGLGTPGGSQTCGSPTTIDSSTSVSAAEIAADTATGQIWIVYELPNASNYDIDQKGYSGGSWGSVQTIDSNQNTTGTGPSVQQNKTNSKVGVMFVTGSALPVTLWYDTALSLNSAPSAPSLTSPAQPLNGATGVGLSSYAFKARAADANGDYLRYEFIVYDSANCTSTVMEDAVEPSGSQPSWSGQDQQSSTAYTGNATESSSTMAVHAYGGTAFTANHTYSWKAAAKDPGGTNTLGSFSACASFVTNAAPAVPTLIVPASGASVGSNVQFQLKSTDADSDYLRYKLRLFTGSGITSNSCTGSEVTGSPFDQIGGSQTGWMVQNAQSATAYTSGPSSTTTQTAIFEFTPHLTPNTVYCWEAWAQDPGGTNTLSAQANAQLFTVISQELFIQGNVKFGGAPGS